VGLRSRSGNAFIIEVNKNNLADIALSTAKKLGATTPTFASIVTALEAISTREKQVQNVQRGQNFGFGVRVLVKGTWGFAASPNVTEAEVRRATPKRSKSPKRIRFFSAKNRLKWSAPKVTANWKSSFVKDPFDVPVDDKIAVSC
jgi:TldD protein